MKNLYIKTKLKKAIKNNIMPMKNKFKVNNKCYIKSENVFQRCVIYVSNLFNNINKIKDLDKVKMLKK